MRRLRLALPVTASGRREGSAPRVHVGAASRAARALRRWSALSHVRSRSARGTYGRFGPARLAGPTKRNERAAFCVARLAGLCGGSPVHLPDPVTASGDVPARFPRVGLCAQRPFRRAARRGRGQSAACVSAAVGDAAAVAGAADVGTFGTDVVRDCPGIPQDSQDQLAQPHHDSPEAAPGGHADGSSPPGGLDRALRQLRDAGIHRGLAGLSHLYDRTAAGQQAVGRIPQPPPRRPASTSCRPRAAADTARRVLDAGETLGCWAISMQGRKAAGSTFSAAPRRATKGSPCFRWPARLRWPSCMLRARRVP